MLKALLDTGIAQKIYPWNAVVIFLVGLVIDIALGVIFKTEKWNVKIAIIAVSVLAICLSTLNIIVSSNCVKVPENIKTDMPLNQVQARIINCDLRCSEENIKLDSAAQEKHMAGITLNDPCYYVTSISPLPGTLVVKNSEIELSVTWKSNQTEPTEETEEKEEEKGSQTDEITEEHTGDRKKEETNAADEKAPQTTENAEGTPDTYMNPFPDFDPDQCSAEDVTEIELSSKELVLIICDDYNREYTMGYIPAEQSALVQYEIIDFYTGKTIDKKNEKFGRKVYFDNIPDGVYYYKISCDGYMSFMKDEPFAVKHGYSTEKKTIDREVDLEKINAIYGSWFKVKMLYAGEPDDSYAQLYVTVSRKGESAAEVSYHPLTINKDGFLAHYGWLNDIWYDYVVDFLLADGYTLLVQNHNEELMEASPIIDGICTLQY